MSSVCLSSVGYNGTLLTLDAIKRKNVVNKTKNSPIFCDTLVVKHPLTLFSINSKEKNNNSSVSFFLLNEENRKRIMM